MKKAFRFFSFFAAFTVVISAQSQNEKNNPKGKVWEEKNGNPFYYQEGKYTASFRKSFRRDRPETDFLATVTNRNWRSSVNDIHIEYRGSCAEQILVKAKFAHGGDRTELANDYKASGKGSDLPIHELLKPLLKGLKIQCNELKSIRLEMPISKDHVYRGTMNKSNNWKLEDGFQQNDNNYVINLDTGVDMQTLLRVNYTGTCETIASLHIAPSFANKSEEFYYPEKKESISIYDFSKIAQQAVNKYKDECLNVETIKLTLGYVPNKYRCKEGKACVLTANKSENWKVDTSNFEIIPIEPPLMSDYGDIIQLLNKGDFKSFENYTQFFKTFYEDYSSFYGDFCRQNLSTPTKLTIRTFEQKYDNFGQKVSERELGPPAEIFIETKYLPLYKKFRAQNKITALVKIFQGYAKSLKQQNMNGLQNAILYRLDNSIHIKRHLNGKCNSPKVKHVYAKMQELGKILDTN